MAFKKLAEFPEPCVPLSSRQKKYVDQFNKEALSGAVKFEKVPCLCGSEKFKLIAKYDRYSMLQDTVICKECGFILSNPRMTDEEYKRFYETDTYRKCYESFDYLEGYLARYDGSAGRHILDIVLKVKKAGQISKILEFGTGGGWNLLAFKEKGYDVTGYDYSPSLVELGRKHGLNLFQGTTDSIKGKFDVIILSHVIEHFTDLGTSMSKLKEHLNENGIFYIEVPDVKDFGMGHLQNAHTYYFTLPTLEFYVSKCGLKLIHHETAQGEHLVTIFTLGADALGRNFLKDEFGKMDRIIRRYRVKRSMVGLLDALGLKERIKKIIKK